MTIFGKQVIKVTVRVFIFVAVISTALAAFFLSPRKVEGTGGAFPNTEHGGTDATYPGRSYYPLTDNVTGVSRSHLDVYYDTYNRGECVHCHEPHASYGGQEAVPNWSSHGIVGEGPDQFMLFADYSSKSTRVDFCGYCHTEEDPDANGNPFDTPSGYSFQGATKFKGTAHYQPQGGRNPVQWPGGQYGSTYPAKSSSDSGTCVNCHSPHGYPYSSSYATASSGTPYPKQLVELTDINNKNPSTSPITTWPNVSGRDPDDAEDLCYTCHRSAVVQNKDLSTYNSTSYTGATGIYEAFQQTYHHPVTDSSQTGKASYYQADTAKPMDIHYAVECTTCHNPHLASGRWDDASTAWPSPTPVVLPGVTRKAYQSGVGTYDWPPASWGLSYQPGDLWGDDPEEKLNALMARSLTLGWSCGTGGWEFNRLRGYSFGATNMPCDQPPKYQPPRTNQSTGATQVDGDSLPDYITFCLDCHQHRVGSIMPIYWGGGFPPGVSPGLCDPSTGRPSPEDCVQAQGVEPHGFDAANQPFFGCCSANTTSCLNADIKTSNQLLYSEPNGRGFDIYGRHPYETADRMAGINYVLACTDCHEPHGSSYTKLQRTFINGRSVGSASGDMSGMCDACHASSPAASRAMNTGNCSTPVGSGGCGNASCHETPILHRIKKNNEGGGKIMYTPTWVCASGITMPIKFELNADTPVCDNTGVICGTESNNPVNGNGYFNGNGANTSLQFTNNDTCLLASTTMTIEARIKPTGIPNDTTTGMLHSILRRGQAVSPNNYNYELGVYKWTNGTAHLAGYHPAGTASIVLIATTDLGTNCAGGGTGCGYWKRVVAEYSSCPIVNDHWYKIKATWSSTKATGIPVDIWIKDEGTDGAGAGRNWTTFKNCTDSDQSLMSDNFFKIANGNTIKDNKSTSPAGNDFAFGSNIGNTANWFNGLIDYIYWNLSADYSGVDDGPIY